MKWELTLKPCLRVAAAAGDHIPTVDALSAVRRASARRHAALDQRSLLTMLAQKDCQPSDYEAAMRGLTRFYGTLDRLLVEGEPLRPAGVAPYRLRSPVLREELGDGALEHARTPQEGLGALDSEGAYLGARYAVDGAQFGHRVIATALTRSALAARLRRPRAFWVTTFVAPGEWRMLCTALMTISRRSEFAAAMRTARQVFRHAQICLV